MRDPKISIIIPVYNRSFLIRKTLKSIQDQLYHNWECLVVDDNSTDETWSTVSALAIGDNRIKIFQKPKELPKGPGASRNYGLTKAEGDIIHFLDSDDILGKSLYEEIIFLFVSREAEAVITRVIFYENSTGKISYEPPPFTIKNFIVNGLINHAFCTPNIFWRRCFLDIAKVLFNEKISMAEDLDFNNRNFVQSPKVIIKNDLFIYARKHENSLTRGCEYIIQRNLDWLVVLNNLIELLCENNLYNITVSRYAAKQAKGLLMNLARNNYFSRKVFSHWLFMNRELVKGFQLANLFIYNAKILFVSAVSISKRLTIKHKPV
ncbi:MAG: glycosyltransferase family 2 protein [Candidatus Omnitrophica bacterium]|nr:glycosyltransferase family 2 protein [Candidatus Omnitrophota bacterium]